LFQQKTSLGKLFISHEPEQRTTWTLP